MNLRIIVRLCFGGWPIAAFRLSGVTGVVEQWIPPIAQTLSGAFPSFKFWHKIEVHLSPWLGQPTAA